MDESDKISSEHNQENTVITINQPHPLSQNRSQTNDCTGINESNAGHINELQIPSYGNIPQNADYTHKTQSSRCSQGENYNQIDVNLQSDHSVQPLQSLEGEIEDRRNISSKEPSFFQRNDENVGDQRMGQTTRQSVVLIGDSIIKNILPQKLTWKKVYKYTYPGKTIEKIN